MAGRQRRTVLARVPAAHALVAAAGLPLPALAGRRLRRPARPPHRFWRQRGARADPPLVAYSAERAPRRNRHRHGPGGRDVFDRNTGPRRRTARRLADPRTLASLPDAQPADPPGARGPTGSGTHSLNDA